MKIPPLNSLVWGSLRLAPIKASHHLFLGSESAVTVSYCFLHAGTVFWAGLTLTSAQNRSSHTCHIACWTSTTKSCEPAVLA